MAKTARGKKSPKEKAKAAKDLLANAPDILEEVDVKHTKFFHLSQMVCKLLVSFLVYMNVNTFCLTELSFGAILGVGGFCVVREIVNVKLMGSNKAKETISSEDLLLQEASHRFGGKGLLPKDSFYDISEARELMAKNHM